MPATDQTKSQRAPPVSRAVRVVPTGAARSLGWHDPFALAHIGVWNWDARTDAVTGSQELRRIFGLDPNRRMPDFAAQKDTLYPAASWTRLHAAMHECLRTGERFELDLVAHRIGEEIWLANRAEPSHDVDGRIVGVRGTVQDITTHKRAEAALRESERRERERAAELSALLEIVPAPVFIAHDPDCQHITGNRAADELLQIPRGAEASLGAAAEMRPQHFRALKDGRELRLEELPAQRAARGNPVRDYEFDLAFADGTVRHVLAYATPLWNGEEPRGAVLVLLDITERKRLEAAMQARKLQLRSFVEQAPVAICMLDREMNYLAASERWADTYGRGHTNLEGLNHYVLHPDLPERWRAIHRAALAGESQAANEDLWEQTDGTKMWLRWAVRPWLAPDGTVGGIMMMAENITAQKSVEEALRASEERHRTVLQATRVGTFEVDLSTGATHWNAVEFELLGLKPDEVEASPNMFFHYVHPDDVDSLQSEWETAMRTGVLDTEFRVVRADGCQRWLAAKGRFVPAPVDAGTRAAPPVARFLGVNFDVTDQKRASEALNESRQRLASILGSAMDAIISVNADREIVLFNLAAEKMFACRAQDALGTRVDRFFPGYEGAAFAERLRRIAAIGPFETAASGTAVNGQRTNGELFPVEASVSRVEVGGGPLVTLIVRDVSERKRLEQEVLEISAREQRRIGQDLHDDLCQWLAATEMLCSGLAKGISRELPSHAAQAREIARNIRQALARARALAHGLEPSVIRSEGLAGALKELAANARQTFRIRCRYTGMENVTVRDEVTALHLYRIAQEAIANAVRHGRAKNVQIDVQPIASTGLQMIVSDEGRGIVKPSSESPGMGLRNMRYRASVIGGQLEIRTRAGGGTEVVCRFPSDQTGQQPTKTSATT